MSFFFTELTLLITAHFPFSLYKAVLSRLAALLLVAKLVLPANALDTGISIFAYNDLACDDDSDQGSISTGNLVTDGTCTSLVRKGPVAFRVANPNTPFTSCRVNVYPSPDAGEKPCSGQPVAAGEAGTTDDGRCFAYAGYSHYTVDGCDSAWVEGQNHAAAEERARSLQLRGIIAGTIVAVFLVVVAGTTWVVMRARKKMKMEAHGKVEEIELEERERR